MFSTVLRATDKATISRPLCCARRCWSWLRSFGLSINRSFGRPNNSYQTKKRRYAVAFGLTEQLSSVEDCCTMVEHDAVMFGSDHLLHTIGSYGPAPPRSPRIRWQRDHFALTLDSIMLEWAGDCS
ncbi:hypothetical protein MPH_05898 [Macrophomina phaseolina MS6]|uniref:Uncharacterized protein n=1 Tax=Macrophomina phaseolina (strain MS6) TaxID=1126212 RepID=K2RW26_MACPH|nr:hypothetical protein MPH_05898 [Macrophomina phaseolina MS6]